MRGQYTDWGWWTPLGSVLGRMFMLGSSFVLPE
jgi:hypothetical protein